MKHCVRCVLPSTYKTITFDSDGVCNYCNAYEQLKGKLTDYPRLQSLLDSRLEAFRGKQEYDCLVGLSGGKDSSYVAYRMARHHGLKTLAITFDNGWLTDYGRTNIARIVEALGIDHEYIRIDWALHRAFYREIVKFFGVPCPGCSYATGLISHRIAVERNIPMMFHGRSRSQMFRELAPGSSDIFTSFLKHNFLPYEPDVIKTAFLEVMGKVEGFIKSTLPDRAIREKFRQAFFPPLDIYREMARPPELLGYFLYFPYDERAMMKELEAETGWSKPRDLSLLTHNDCLVHDAVDYLYPQAFDFPLLSFELSVMIREGDLTREEALERLAEEERMVGYPEESLGFLCDRLGLSPGELPIIMKRVKEKHKLLMNIKRVKNWLTKPGLDI